MSEPIQDKPIKLSYENADIIYTYLWYMLASKDNTFTYVPPEKRNREALQKACDAIMYETIRVKEEQNDKRFFLS